jgi:hypothetical protein
MLLGNAPKKHSSNIGIQDLGASSVIQTACSQAPNSRPSKEKPNLEDFADAATCAKGLAVNGHPPSFDAQT